MVKITFNINSVDGMLLKINPFGTMLLLGIALTYVVIIAARNMKKAK